MPLGKATKPVLVERVSNLANEYGSSLRVRLMAPIRFLQALLKAKLKGKKLPDDDSDEKPEKTKVIDLVARLQESLASTAARKRTAKSATTKKKTARAKSARKRRAS